MSGSAQYQITNFNSDTPAALKIKLDGNSMALQAAAAFQPYADAPASMHVKVAPGSLNVGGSVVTQGVQTSAIIVAPVTHPRIDRIVLDPITALIALVAGAESVSPVPPPLPTGLIAISQISLLTTTASIVNSQITDERILVAPPSSGAAPDFLLAPRGII